MDKIFDVEHQFSCYGGYRKSKFHVLLHGTFVWTMYFGIIFLLCYSPPVLVKPIWVDHYVHPKINEHIMLNYAFVAAVSYSLLYIYADIKAGFLTSTLVTCCWIAGCAATKAIQWDLAWKVVLAGELVCFTAQTLGRGPPGISHAGIVENFGQMLVLGPFFIILELLDFVGYTPYPGFGRITRNSIYCDDCCPGESCSSSDSDCCG
ncbi:hypothetical protein M758_4G104100 [Ceratodon purpureus]|uniref:Uncharacterized protein n=1 Tax=Ceratodon purpureus TaxID=3225 RepID=A0A8T0I9D6_CERPU|nr:hypothetical protein KC19_4G105800 [Ceratodon purpureus]KAG0618954.1 hypothetical protein M758_4G104100 [Ceratodon purpureus]